MSKKQAIQFSVIDKNTPFSVAIAELEDISNLLQVGQIEIEDISAYYKRAVELKSFCLNRLQSIELEIENIDSSNNKQGDHNNNDNNK